MRLRGRHLVHQVGRVYRLVLRLRVQQLRVEGGAVQEGRVNCLVLIAVVLGEEVVEVDVVVGGGVVANVQWIGREVVALGPKVRARRASRYVLAGVEEVGARDGGLVGELLRLGGGEELRRGVEGLSGGGGEGIVVGR